MNQREIRKAVNAIRREMKPLEDSIKSIEVVLEKHQEEIYKLQDECKHPEKRVKVLYFNPYYLEGKKRCTVCDYEWTY